jgi:hypothetical protein
MSSLVYMQSTEAQEGAWHRGKTQIDCGVNEEQGK